MTAKKSPNSFKRLSPLFKVKRHSMVEIQNIFWKVFRYAIKLELEEKGEANVQDVATLFDQLIALSGAVEALQQSRSGAPLSKTEGGEQHV